ncbi:MAG: TolC family protein [Oligoflexia bacterium]|nr:TolC family protein [Oligoflexia bacterium]
MKRPKLRALVPLLLVASACASGPDYRKPEILTKADQKPEPFLSANTGAFSTEAPMTHWWTLYQDAHLNGFIEQALKANTDLRIAYANLERAQAYVTENQGAQLPQTTIDAGESRGRPSLYAVEVPATEFTMNIWHAGGAISYDLDFFGRLRRLVEASRADAEAAQAAYELTRVHVVAETVRSYVEICSSGRQLEVALRSVKSQEQSYAMVEHGFEAGHGTSLDVERAHALLEQLRSAVPIYENRRKLALFRLATVLGMVPHAFPPEIENCNAPPQVSTPIPVGDGVALIRRRPDIRQAERQLAAQNARIGAAIASLYPSVSLGLSGGTTALTASDMASGPATYWSLGPLIHWNFPNIIAARARIRESEASTRAALAAFDGTVLTALRETESALSTYAHELSRHHSLLEAQKSSAAALEIAQKMYRAGAGSFYDVLDAERTFASSDAALAQSEAELADGRVTLFLALGGGWEPASSSSQ